MSFIKGVGLSIVPLLKALNSSTALAASCAPKIDDHSSKNFAVPLGDLTCCPALYILELTKAPLPKASTERKPEYLNTASTPRLVAVSEANSSATLSNNPISLGVNILPLFKVDNTPFTVFFIPLT